MMHLDKRQIDFGEDCSLDHLLNLMVYELLNYVADAANMSCFSFIDAVAYI